MSRARTFYAVEWAYGVGATFNGGDTANVREFNTAQARDAWVAARRTDDPGRNDYRHAEKAGSALIARHRRRMMSDSLYAYRKDTARA